LPDHAGWSELLSSPADSCVTVQLQLFGQLLPQQGGGSSSLNAALRFRRSAMQSTTCPALEVAFCCACLLGFLHWGVLSLPHPLSLGQVQCSIGPLCCQYVMMVHCLFFSFAGQFGFGCCSLAQEMISVLCYLPCFGEWLLAHLLSAFLPFQFLLTNSSC
jgi:hypothetical protein